MARSLSVDRVVRVSVNLQPKAAPRRNFGVLCIAGPSPVIDQQERLRFYTGIDGVAGDFGLDAPEYKAAELFFSQSPRPYVLAVGRWVNVPAPALLVGGLVRDADRDASAWSSITGGSFGLVVNGTGATVDDLDFTGKTNMNGVASVISAGLSSSGASCLWEGDHFVIKTSAAGGGKVLGFAVDAATGTDISAKMAMTEDLALPLVSGMDAATPLECAAALADAVEWYGLAFAAPITDDEHVALSGFI